MILSSIRRYLILGLAIISIASISIAVGLYFHSKSLSEDLDNTRIELAVKTDTVLHLKDKNGKDFVRMASYVKTIDDLKHSNDSIETRLYNEAKNNKIKDGRIEQLQYALLNATGHIVVVEKPINVLDTNARNIRFNNKYLDATVSFSPNKDTICLDYVYNTEIYVTKNTYRPKSNNKLFKWLGISFKNKRSQYDFKLSDSNAIIKDARVIDIEK